MLSTLKRRLADSEFFWNRHANPASGWSRVPTGPLPLYAIYARNWRLFAAVVGFVAVNPILFPEREPTDSGEEGWMTGGVRGERLWLGGADAGRANLLNAANVPTFVVAIWAAIRRKPRTTVIATALSTALKLAFVNATAKLYEREAADERVRRRYDRMRASLASPDVASMWTLNVSPSSVTARTSHVLLSR